MIAQLETYSPNYMHVLIQDALKPIEPKSEGQKADEILKVVCDFYMITPEKIRERIRRRHIVLSRQVLMYMLKKYTKMSYKMIGEYCSDPERYIYFDHTTAIYSLQTVEALMSSDPIYKQDIETITKRINRLSLN